MHNPIVDSVFGYYKVGDQLYLNKTEALYNATQSNQEVDWNFHNEVYSKINWTERPTGTLAELYRERAQQIRDTYDHVIVYFSGGMDSYTVLHSFLSNNIHIDEIVTLFPRRAERKIQPVSTRLDQSNIGSEYELAVYPVIKHIKKHFPKVNIVVHDFSDTIEREMKEQDFKDAQHWQSLMAGTKWHQRTELEIEAMNHNKSIAVVNGADKIHILSKDGNLYGYFQDCIGGADQLGRSVECFYWTPKFPLIPVMQAHYLKDFLIQDHNENPNKSYSMDDTRTIYQHCCYPDYDINTFQVNKYGGTWNWPSDGWIKEYNPLYYNSWEWITNQYFKSIDEKFLRQNSTHGIMGFRFSKSPYYLVAENTSLPDFFF